MLSSGGYSPDGTVSNTVAVNIVSSPEEFRSIFAATHSTSAALLLCYEHPLDHITSSELQDFVESVQHAVSKSKSKLDLFLWDCTPVDFAAAKLQLDKAPGSPLLVIVYGGAIVDTVRAVSLAEMARTDISRICTRLASFQASAKPAHIAAAGPSTSADPQSERSTSPDSRLVVDVAKMVGMGKKLMAERQPFYAEKFFLKALQALDTLLPEVQRLVVQQEDYDGSVALCLAWAGLAQLVQGKEVAVNTYLRRLTKEDRFQPFRDEPLSEVCRALTTWALMQAAPAPWDEKTCSNQHLRAALNADPHNDVLRSLLVITLFLSGDLERTLTEALKLKLTEKPFGQDAVKQLRKFLGDNHPLIEAVHPLLNTLPIKKGEE